MKVPEQFRDSTTPPYLSKPGDLFGVFIVPANHAPHGRALKMIAADGQETGWDHVSVSLWQPNQRIKQLHTWREMCFVKSLFWDESECVVQFHPPQENYVNLHPGVLHLWKQTNGAFPMPPIECV